MMMRKRIGWLAMGLLALLGTDPARAVGISLVLPGGTEVTVGEQVSIEVVVSELGDGVAPTLGSFDGDVTFDPGLLTYDDVAFGLELGEPVTEALVSVDVVGGVLTGTAVSLLSPAELDALQGSSVTLGTIFFTASGLGSGQIEVTRAQLSDAFGAPLAIDWLGSSPITVIPEPTTALLVACGLVGMAIRRRRGA
jgi:hypothetical protein